jgi:hypothetical protein
LFTLSPSVFALLLSLGCFLRSRAAVVVLCSPTALFSNAALLCILVVYHWKNYDYIANAISLLCLLSSGARQSPATQKVELRLLYRPVFAAPAALLQCAAAQLRSSAATQHSRKHLQQWNQTRYVLRWWVAAA